MNGKGDKPRKKTVDQKTWDQNWELAFGRKDYGIKVRIKLADDRESEGYIVRRHSVDNYEVWCEEVQQTMFLCPEEFKEVD